MAGPVLEDAKIDDQPIGDQSDVRSDSDRLHLEPGEDDEGDEEKKHGGDGAGQSQGSKKSGGGKLRHRIGNGARRLGKGIKHRGRQLFGKALQQGAETGTAAAITGASGGTLAPVSKPLAKILVVGTKMGAQFMIGVGKFLLKAESLGQRLTNLRKAITKFFTGTAVGILIIALIIIMFIYVIIAVLAAFFASEEAPSDTLTITKTADASANIGDEVTYRVHVVETAQAKDTTIVDVLPTGTVFVRAVNAKVYCDGYNSVCDHASRVIMWKASQNNITAPYDIEFDIVVRVIADNVYLANTIHGSSDVPGVPVSSGSFVAAAAADSCGGKYSSYVQRNFLLTKNYGDPACDFSKDALYAFIKAQENDNMEFVNYWFFDIIPGESSYNPNAWASPNVPGQCALDCQGAWGLYQMGSSQPPGSNPPAPGKNGPYDRGDVNWQIQTTNAITYNRERLDCNFWYWSTFRRAHPGQRDRC